MLSLRSILSRQHCYFDYDRMLRELSMTFLCEYYRVLITVYWLLIILS